MPFHYCYFFWSTVDALLIAYLFTRDATRVTQMMRPRCAECDAATMQRAASLRAESAMSIMPLSIIYAVQRCAKEARKRCAADEPDYAA